MTNGMTKTTDGIAEILDKLEEMHKHVKIVAGGVQMVLATQHYTLDAELTAVVDGLIKELGEIAWGHIVHGPWEEGAD